MNQKRESIIVAAILTSFAMVGGSRAIEADDQWPQSYETPAYEIAIYQPQVYEWEDFKRAKARVAIAVKAKAGGDETRATFGAMMVEANTVTDFDERVVHFGGREVSVLRFPEVKSPEETMAMERAVRSVLTPSRPVQVSLDAMMANLERSEIEGREIEVNLAPPPIFYSSEPAILVMFIGEPAFEAVVKGSPTLLFARNTNWDVLLDVNTGTYYMLAGDFWLKTVELKKKSLI